VVGGQAGAQSDQLGHPRVGHVVEGEPALTTHHGQPAGDQAGQVGRHPPLGETGALHALGASGLSPNHEECQQVEAGGVTQGPEELGDHSPGSQVRGGGCACARGGPGHVAQQDSLETSVRKAWAASLIPSLMVRYGAQVPAIWATVMPASSA